MRTIDIENWNRKKTYLWFKEFSNPCYGVTSKLNITKLIDYKNKNDKSFFICLLYLVVKAMNNIEEMKMRLVNDKPVVFDRVTPAYTVMTNDGCYDNVRHDYFDDFKKFYDLAKENIETAKLGVVKEENYNNNNFDELYITCLPWMSFTHMTHPIPDAKDSQSVPRVCWDKYTKENNEYFINMNITVSHIFVDGKVLSDTFEEIQKLINCCENILI